MDDKTYYLAGPMTGYPQFNFPLFLRVAKELRDMGYKIISPAELDSDAVREEAMASEDGTMVAGKVAGESWGDMLSRDVKMVADEVDGVIVLDGWDKSKGARLEVFVALLCNKDIIAWDDGPYKLGLYCRQDVLDIIHEEMSE